MKLFNTALMGALLTFTATTVAQASPSEALVKAETQIHTDTLASGCNGWDPRACGKQ